jgi:formate hydrogenlyase transcriptional activator
MFQRAGEITFVRSPGRVCGLSGPIDGGADRSSAAVSGQVPPVTPIDGQLQTLVAQIAAEFVAVDVQAFDAAVNDALRRVAETLHLECAILWQTTVDPQTAVASHSWMLDTEQSPPGLTVAQFPHTVSRLQGGNAAHFANPEAVPNPVDCATFKQRGMHAAVLVPVPLSDRTEGAWGALGVGSSTAREWRRLTFDSLHVLAAVVGQALARRAGLKELAAAQAELRDLREGMRPEPVSLRPRSVLSGGRRLVAESLSIQRAFKQVEQVAATPSTVLLLGETGVGKEVLAQAIHDLSPRRRPMIRVNCAAIPSTLIESELFGHERGAYTGAISRQIGRFEAADKSTLFLDEIGDLPAEVQVKLLRVLQERVIERLGSTQPIKVDVRIIAATNRNLEKAVTDEIFREDLFYRLNVFPIAVPPLRERVEDIPALACQFLEEYAGALGRPIDSISKASMRQLEAYTWPGNIRELRNVIERAVIMADGPVLHVEIPVRRTPAHPHIERTLRDLEVEHIRSTLDRTNWRIRGHGGAAERLGLKPTTLETRMSKLGIVRPARDTWAPPAASEF